MYTLIDLYISPFLKYSASNYYKCLNDSRNNNNGLHLMLCDIFLNIMHKHNLRIAYSDGMILLKFTSSQSLNKFIDAS